MTAHKKNNNSQQPEENLPGAGDGVCASAAATKTVKTQMLKNKAKAEEVEVENPNMVPPVGSCGDGKKGVCEK